MSSNNVATRGQVPATRGQVPATDGRLLKPAPLSRGSPRFVPMGYSQAVLTARADRWTSRPSSIKCRNTLAQLPAKDGSLTKLAKKVQQEIGAPAATGPMTQKDLERKVRQVTAEIQRGASVPFARQVIETREQKIKKLLRAETLLATGRATATRQKVTKATMRKMREMTKTTKTAKRAPKRTVGGKKKAAKTTKKKTARTTKTARTPAKKRSRTQHHAGPRSPAAAANAATARTADSHQWARHHHCIPQPGGAPYSGVYKVPGQVEKEVRRLQTREEQVALLARHLRSEGVVGTCPCCIPVARPLNPDRTLDREGFIRSANLARLQREFHDDKVTRGITSCSALEGLKALLRQQQELLAKERKAYEKRCEEAMKKDAKNMGWTLEEVREGHRQLDAFAEEMKRAPPGSIPKITLDLDDLADLCDSPSSPGTSKAAPAAPRTTKKVVPVASRTQPDADAMEVTLAPSLAHSGSTGVRELSPEEFAEREERAMRIPGSIHPADPRDNWTEEDWLDFFASGPSPGHSRSNSLGSIGSIDPVDHIDWDAVVQELNRTPSPPLPSAAPAAVPAIPEGFTVCHDGDF